MFDQSMQDHGGAIVNILSSGGGARGWASTLVWDKVSAGTSLTEEMMALVPFHMFFPDRAADEGRTITLPGDAEDLTLALVEYYCPDPACDCRRVQLQFTDPLTLEVLAAVSHGFNPWTSDGWDDEQTYLEPLAHQSEFAGELFELFEQAILTPAYERRLKRHYRMVKDAVAADPDLAGLGGLDLLDRLAGNQTPYRADEEPGRNDPCLCGSGKKYKKCCLRKQKSSGARVAPSRPSRPSIAERTAQRLASSGTEVQVVEGYAQSQGRESNAETLEMFAWPLVSDLRDPTVAELEVSYSVAMLVWNSVVTDDDSALEELRTLMGEEATGEVWELLSERKRELFGDDDRYFVDLEVSMTQNGPYLEVAAVF